MKYRAWRLEQRAREEREAAAVEDRIETRRREFVDAKAYAAAALEDERERKRKKRLRDLQTYLATGVVQSGQALRVPLLMADSDADRDVVMPLDHPLHGRLAAGAAARG
jgi:hypothetical protein